VGLSRYESVLKKGFPGLLLLYFNALKKFMAASATDRMNKLDSAR